MFTSASDGIARKRDSKFSTGSVRLSPTIATAVVRCANRDLWARRGMREARQIDASAQLICDSCGAKAGLHPGLALKETVSSTSDEQSEDWSIESVVSFESSVVCNVSE
jgi:hypothetical protein